jgi:hypothetical protein
MLTIHLFILLTLKEPPWRLTDQSVEHSSLHYNATNGSLITHHKCVNLFSPYSNILPLTGSEQIQACESHIYLLVLNGL